MENCKHCNSELNGNYCSNCGQPGKLKRIDLQYVKQEIGQLLHIEKGFLYTIKEILIRPGQSVREYIFENRKKLINPFTFLIITSLIYTIVNNYFRIEESYTDYAAMEELQLSTLIKILKWMMNNYGYSNIISGFFFASWIWVFFKKYGYSYLEILIFLCFISGIEVMIFALFGIIEGLTKAPLFFIANLFVVAYSVWATGRFFEIKPITYLKVFGVYILVYITLILLLTFLGVIFALY